MNDIPAVPQICPRCGRKYKEPPAISRVDNKTEICPLCGTREALDALGLSGWNRNTSLLPSISTAHRLVTRDNSQADSDRNNALNLLYLSYFIRLFACYVSPLE